MKITFTQHSEKRIIIRKILKEEVIEAIKSPDKTIKKHGKHYFQKILIRGSIEVVKEKTESNLNVVTIYWI